MVAERIKLRPHDHLFRQGVVAFLAFMAPVFVVLYVLTVPHGPWVAVLVTQAIALVAFVVVSVLFFRVAIWVDSTGITEIGFLGRTTRVEAADIGSLFLVEMYEASGMHTVPQLFVRNRDGCQVMRMRGQFWSKASMDTVVATLEVPKEASDQAVSSRELRDEYPGLLYWFERRPVIAALAFGAGVAIVAAVVYSVFMVTT